MPVASPRRRLLLGVVAVLALLRFAVVPWLDAQADARERLQVLTQRLDRSVGVVQNREAILSAAAALRASTADSRGRFPIAASAEAFRLDEQRRIGAVVAGAGLKLALFDWVLEGTVPDGGLAYGRVRFQVEGALRDVIRVHGELEGGLPNIAVREVLLNLGMATTQANETSATMAVVADSFFRLQGPP